MVISQTFFVNIEIYNLGSSFKTTMPASMAYGKVPNF